jgi:hypothetical protein
MFNRLSYLLICLVLLTCTPRLLATEVPTASQSIPADMARLIPAEAVAIAYTDSVSNFTANLTKLVSAVNPQWGGMVAFMGPTSLLKQQVNTKSTVLTDAPAAMVFWPGATLKDPPNYAVIFSIEGASPATVRAMDRGNRLVFLEGTNWLAVSNAASSWDPAAVDSPTPTLAKDLLPGMLTIHLDVEQINATRRGELEAWTSTGDFDHVMLSVARSIVRFDMGLTMENGAVDLAMRYTPTIGSKTAMKGDNALIALSNRLPGDLPMQMVVGNALLKAGARWFFEEQSKDMKHLAAFKTALDEMQNEVVDGMGISMGFSEYGLDMVKVFQVKDSARMFTMMDRYIAQINDAELGMNIERMKVLVGGDSARAYRVKAEGPNAAELQPMLGPDGMIIRIISNKNMMAAVTGAPKLLGRTRRALAQASLTETAIDTMSNRVGGDMIMGMTMDLRSYVRGFSDFVIADPTAFADSPSPFPVSEVSQIKINSGPSATMDVSLSSHGDAVKLELDIEVVKIYKLYTEINDQVERIQKKKEAEAAKVAAQKAEAAKAAQQNAPKDPDKK